MINLLVISHSDLAHGLLSAAGLIVGEVPHAASMGLYPGTAFDEFVAEVGEKIKSMDEGDGVLVLVDLFGGTPSNATLYSRGALGDSVNYKVVSGANLPMLLEAHIAREGMTLDELKDHCVAQGADGVKDVFKELGF